MAYVDTIRASNPKCYYRLEDSGTTMVDRMGVANGTWGTTPVAAASLAPDGSGAALSAGWVSGGPSGADAHPWATSAEWTVACFIKPASLSIANHRILSRFAAKGGVNWILQLNSGDLWIYEADNGPGSTYGSAPSGLVVGQTAHVFLVRTAGSISAYINGVKKVTLTVPPTTVTDASSKFRIGSTVYGSDGLFSGTIDEVVCYDRVQMFDAQGMPAAGGSATSSDFTIGSIPI